MKSTPEFSKRDLIIIVIALLTQFTTSFIGSMIQVALPMISNDLHLTVELANWISIAYMIALIAVSIRYLVLSHSTALKNLPSTA